MPLDPQFRAVLDALEASGALPLTRSSVAETRERYRAMGSARRAGGFVPEAVATVEDHTLAGPGGPLPVRVYVPDDARDAAVTWLHGGGWVLGDLDTHDPVCRRVANACRATVVSVDYRLAPEAPFPAALDDAVAALAWTADHTGAAAVGVAGDSAGASLAAGAALAAAAAGTALAGQLLVYPATDPSMALGSYTDNGDGYFLTREAMAWFYGQYLPGGTDDPRAHLLTADVTGVAPAVVATAEFDPLRDDGAAYAERLAAAGVPVTYLPGPGLIHGYLAFLGVVGAADRRSSEVLAAFGELLAAGPGPGRPR